MACLENKQVWFVLCSPTCLQSNRPNLELGNLFQEYQPVTLKTFFGFSVFWATSSITIAAGLLLNLFMGSPSWRMAYIGVFFISVIAFVRGEFILCNLLAFHHA